MAPRLTRSVLHFAAIIAVLTSGPSVLARGDAQGLTRTVFVSVLAKDGTPVTDMTSADFEVKEGGKVQEITSIKPATTPIRLHTIVSDGGTGAFQLGILRMAQALQGSTEFAFTSVLVQPRRLTGFTDNGQKVGESIQQLGPRGTTSGGHQVMEAIVIALEDIAAPGKRPVLLVLRIGNEGSNPVTANVVREALRKTGTTLYVVSRSGASRPAATYSGASGMSSEVAQRQMEDADRADTAMNLNLVLGDGSRESGGYQQEIALTTAVPTLEQLAREIKTQYEITYVLPAGTKPSDRLQVTTKRKNVTLRAPQKIAN